jgi:hypothetical protein
MRPGLRWLFILSLFFSLLSLVALICFGLNLVTLYWFGLSAVASFVFWRESSPARGEESREAPASKIKRGL